MNRKQFAIYAALICAIMGVAVGYGVSKRNALLPAIAFVVGTALVVFGKRSVKEVMEDERTRRVSEKASRVICRLFVMGAALIGTTLVALNKHIEVGYTLTFLACALLVLYLVLYSFYNKGALQ